MCQQRIVCVAGDRETSVGLIGTDRFTRAGIDDAIDRADRVAVLLQLLLDLQSKLRVDIVVVTNVGLPQVSQQIRR